MEELPMTYDEALSIITACANASTTNKRLKEALQISRQAIRTELGRWRRFDTDLESAESDYVRDIAYDQNLDGENADDFFGKVKADGFDLMEAFRDGAEWYRDRDTSNERWTNFDHVKEILRLVLESHMHGGESDEVLAELDEQVREAWIVKYHNKAKED